MSICRKSLPEEKPDRIPDLSGLKVTHIRPTFFAEWLIYAGSIKKNNNIALLFGESRYAPLAAEDQGRVIETFEAVAPKQGF